SFPHQTLAHGAPLPHSPSPAAAAAATMPDLPIDADGVCMVCRATAPPEVEVLRCSTCATPWHTPCLSKPPPALSDAASWSCPDCSGDAAPVAPAAPVAGGELVAAIRAIEADATLSDQEKARRRQKLLAGSAGEDENENVNDAAGNDVLDIIGKTFSCVFCMKLPDRPITTPCGHNFCLKCFEKWIHSGKKTCGICRAQIPPKMAELPRINSALVEAIHVAKISRKAISTSLSAPLQCRQWGAHFPHIAGIAGQATYGAQSVALSGGYQDDEDHGEWFLYTGSGGRDLSGNKRTNKEQAFDQDFMKLNAALRLSCLRGYPVRVVRSHKEKRSSYAPESGVRYDGIYRIEKCWRKIGIQVTTFSYIQIVDVAPCFCNAVRKFKVCRYLFVCCDNEPAPWTSDDHGDRPRALPSIAELQDATDITERNGRPSWDYDEKEGWKWMVPPPISRKPVSTGVSETGKLVRRRATRRAQMSIAEGMLEGYLFFCSIYFLHVATSGFRCSICRAVMKEPLTTPCAHNFCKTCLLGAYDSQCSIRERSRGGRTLRAQKIVKKCPSCPTDICDFLANPQINREMMDLIESLQKKAAEGNEIKEASDRGDEESEEDGGGLEMDEAAGCSLNVQEQDSANDRENSNVNADAFGKSVVDMEEGQQPQKHKEAEEGEEDMNMKTSAPEVVLPLAAVKTINDESSKVVQSNQSQQPQKNKGGTKIGSDSPNKRVKTSGAVKETDVCCTSPVE
ncbi:hypothetical protein U9M48_012371, partial [Paspalum notatum var. saurae]